jgi:hypothetical protein
MRDWVLVLGPVGLVVYFIAYPAQFTALMEWLERVMR